MNINVKLICCITLLLSSSMVASQANKDLSCPDKPYYITFDEDDMMICENIIDYGLSHKPLSSKSVVISVYADKHYSERNDWVSSFVFDGGVQIYYFYNFQDNKITTISQGQFNQKLQAINKCNNRPEVPLFKKVISDFNSK